MFKKVGAIFLFAIVAVGIFYSGFQAGVNTFLDITAKSEYSEYAAKLAESTLLLENLKNGNEQDLKFKLIFKQDTEILYLSSILDSLNEDSKTRLKKTLGLIAKRRLEDNEFYLTKGYVNDHVDEILKGYR